MNVLPWIIRWGTLALWLLWLVFYWLRPYFPGTKGGSTRNSTLDTVLMFAIGMALVGLVGGSLGISVGQISAPASGPFAFIGIVLACMGLYGMFYARRYLGRLWVAATVLQQEHHIIDSGPYGVVRHPIYTCVAMFILGTVLVFPHGWNWAMGGVAILCYALKAVVEERFLATHLPGYTLYQQKVRYRLFPYFW